MLRGVFLIAIGAAIAMWAHGHVVEYQTLAGQAATTLSADHQSNYETLWATRGIGVIVAIAGFAEIFEEIYG